MITSKVIVTKEDIIYYNLYSITSSSTVIRNAHRLEPLTTASVTSAFTFLPRIVSYVHEATMHSDQAEYYAIEALKENPTKLDIWRY